MLKTLKYRAIAGIASAIIYIPLTVFEFLRIAKKLGDDKLLIYYVLIILNSVIYIYFIWGFEIIGDKRKNKLLSITSILLAISAVISYGFAFFDSQFTPLLKIILGSIAMIILGVIGILFGISLIRLKDKFGNLAKATGILNIISGASSVTVIFFFIGLILFIPLAILEIILMFKAAEKL